MISDDEKERVRDATDIVELVGETVQLRPRGSDFWGRCPFHNEKSASFHVVPERGLWKCFGCGRGGDVFSFVQQRDHVEFPEAIRILAERAGIELKDEHPGSRHAGPGIKKDRLIEAMEAAVEIYHRQLTRVRTSDAQAARSYLAGRQFGSAVAARWDLGYAPGRNTLVEELTRRGFSRKELLDARLASPRDDGQLRDAFYGRVIFPIRDDRGRAVALGGRVLDDRKPKYVNSADSAIYSKTRTLFALDRAKAHITAAQEVIIEEGYTDVIATHEAGIQNAVAPLGTALTAQHVKMLTRYLTASGEQVARGRIICLFDGDAAGLRAAERALSFQPLTAAQMYVVSLPDKQDPAEFLAARGADAMRQLLASPEPLARFVINRHLERFSLDTPEGRANALSDVVQAMGPLKQTALADSYIVYVAGRLLVGEQTVRTALSKVRWVAPPAYEGSFADGTEDSMDTGGPGPGGTSRAPGQRSRGPRQAQLSAAPGAEAATSLADGRGAEIPGRASFTPEDAAMVQMEQEVLYILSEDVALGAPHFDQLAQISWADPRNKAIAWALLMLPPGTGAKDALKAALAVEPDAAGIIARGMFQQPMDPASEEQLAQTRGSAQNALRLQLLVHGLRLRSLQRQVTQKTAELQSLSSAQEPDAYAACFKEIAQLQQSIAALQKEGAGLV